MSQDSDENKAKAVKFVEEFLNNRNYSVFFEICSPDYKVMGVPSSYENTVKRVQELSERRPGYHFLIDHILSEEEMVAVYWRMMVPKSSVSPAGYLIGANFIAFAGGQAISNDLAGGDDSNFVQT